MYDVIIIGGGICGSSLLYELSHFKLRIALLERANDIAAGTTRANSGIIHAGFDPLCGSNMARCNINGVPLVESLCARLDVPYKKTGSLVTALHQDDLFHLDTLYARGIVNGVKDMRIIKGDELFSLEPALQRDVKAALFAPGAGIVSPWELALAQAEVAVRNGAEVFFNALATQISHDDGVFKLSTAQGSFLSKFIVNAAGIHSDEIARLIGDNSFTISPRKGEYFLLDTTQGDLVSHIIFQCPTKSGKGVLVAPTVHGNLIVGPNNELAGKEDHDTTALGLQEIKEAAQKAVSGIHFNENIRNFTGLRANVDGDDDFIIAPSERNPHFINLGGIKSPGLSAAPAIAKDVLLLLEKAGLGLIEKPDFSDGRKLIRFNELSDREKSDLIRKNPLYGNVVCRCRTITEGEIADLFAHPIRPISLDGVKRRVTAGSGRCQGSFCSPKILSILAKYLEQDIVEIPLDENGSYVITDKL